MTINRVRKSALAASAAFFFCLAPNAQARDFTVASWGGTFQDAQRDIYFKPFAKLSGKPVLDESWEGGVGVLAAKVATGNPNWDAVQVEAEELALGCADGLFEKFDWASVGGKDGFLPAAVSDCGVGTIVWTTGLAYDADRLKQAPQNWADFWDVNKFPGRRGLRRGPKYALEFALLADGVAPKDLYDVLRAPGGVDRAFRKLDEIKSNIVWWESGAQPLQLLSSGQVAMTTAFNGRITGINKSEGRHFKLIWPGSIYAVDSWVVLKGSENKKAAFDFIAFASKGENQAKLAPLMPYGLPNKQAANLISDEVRRELPTDPANLEKAIPLDADFWVDNSEALTQRFNAWLAQ
ncbi:ABC transporter substrate-binding protein [Labrys neptuniae]